MVKSSGENIFSKKYSRDDKMLMKLSVRVMNVECGDDKPLVGYEADMISFEKVVELLEKGEDELTTKEFAQLHQYADTVRDY